MDIQRWFKICCIHVFVLFCISEVVLSQHECIQGLNFPGYTVPAGDIIIEYGNPLDIMCVVHNDSKLIPNASLSLTFARNNTTIPSEMIEIVNSTAIKLHVDKPPKAARDFYTCLMDEKSVCMNIVTVGTKPQPVTDFRCIGYNFVNLTCTWTPPNNFVKTDYNLAYMLNHRSSGYIYDCPSLKDPEENDEDKHMSCFWNISTNPNYRQVHNEYFFTLKMKNKFGENQTEYLFKHFAHVLSGPPENLTVVSTTPSSIYLYWMVPNSMQTFPPGVHHRILYQCQYEDRKWRFAREITDGPKFNERYFNLTNLKHPHAICDIRVSLRSKDAIPSDESMWSRNASITVWTSSTIPDEPPKTDVGSFEIVASGNDIQYREAYIYWQQLKEEQKNGPGFKYNILAEDHPNLQPAELTNAYAEFKNLSISTSYKFIIWSQNANGSSIRKSIVVVPKQADRIKEPQSFTKVEYGHGRYELTWEAPELKPGQRVTNYTIFWCSNNRDRPYQCNGILNWTVVPSTANFYNATVGSDKIYQFAISANTESGSSGMLWAACTVIHNKNIGKMKNVWISKLGSTFIEVGWKLDCSDRIGSVEGFIVYYCPITSPLNTECKGPQKNETFPGDSRLLGGNITSLSPYTTYMLTVAVITKHTTFSQQSDPLYNTTLEAAPSSAPQDFKNISVTNSSVTLSWKPPIAMNGVLKYYGIEYFNKNRMMEVQVGNTTSYTLNSLGSYENYLISIKACTIACSEKSNTLNITTKLGYPSKIRQPTVERRNDSSITIVWNKPSEPNGRNEYYIVQFKQKHKNENVTLLYNVTDEKFVIGNCGDGGKFNAFYISVSAVNMIDDKPHKGPWSDELENYCYTSVNYIVYILSCVVVVFVIGMGYLFNRLYKQCKIMRNVEVKLPPGLAPVVADHTLVAWNTEKHQENRDARSPPDEELLLVKMSEGRHLSGDSSGCSSGHESVTSSLGSGTHISSSSDSGTEQPGNYCVLGVDPKADSSYVSVAADSDKAPPKTCDDPNASSPYVMTGDAVKTINPGYIPFNQTEPIGKSSGYVVAGIKNCNGYIPFNQTEAVNRNTGYVVAGIKNCKLD